MGRGSSKVGNSTTYEDIGFGKVKNPLTQISDTIGLEALSKVSKEMWNQKDYKNVKISSLKSTQNYLIKSDLDYYRSKGFGTETSKGTKDEVTVIRYKGNNILVDGNHRVVLEREKGKKSVNVRYIEV